MPGCVGSRYLACPLLGLADVKRITFASSPRSMPSGRSVLWQWASTSLWHSNDSHGRLFLTKFPYTSAGQVTNYSLYPLKNVDNAGLIEIRTVRHVGLGQQSGKVPYLIKYGNSLELPSRSPKALPIAGESILPANLITIPHVSLHWVIKNSIAAKIPYRYHGKPGSCQDRWHGGYLE